MTLVLLGEGEQAARIVPRVREGEARREDVLRDLLFAQPPMLPVAEIDPAIGPLVPIARELNVPDVGRIDAFLADGRGHLVIVECKLWRCPSSEHFRTGRGSWSGGSFRRGKLPLPKAPVHWRRLLGAFRDGCPEHR